MHGFTPFAASFNYHIKSVNYALIISVFNAENKRPFTPRHRHSWGDNIYISKMTLFQKNEEQQQQQNQTDDILRERGDEDAVVERRGNPPPFMVSASQSIPQEHNVLSGLVISSFGCVALKYGSTTRRCHWSPLSSSSSSLG